MKRQESLRLSLAAAIGHSIASLHNSGLVHGDLTTSNIMIRDWSVGKALEKASITSASSSSSSSSSSLMYRGISDDAPAADLSSSFSPSSSSSSSSASGCSGPSPSLLSSLPAFPFQVVLIDFGLSEVSEAAEDRAVDLYVLQRALSSGHTEEESEGFFDCVLVAYFSLVTDSAGVKKKFENVRMRGRKRLAFG